MPRKKPSQSEFVSFDVVYEDGSRSSNRKVPASQLHAIEGDASAKAIIEAQDRQIATLSGRTRGAIKSITRSPVR